METVQRRDAATLLPIMQAHVAPGTIIHSDEWAAYHGQRTIKFPNYQMSLATRLLSVNHSLTFVSPTGTHTQNIESYWSRVKT